MLNEGCSRASNACGSSCNEAVCTCMHDGASLRPILCKCAGGTYSQTMIRTYLSHRRLLKRTVQGRLRACGCIWTSSRSWPACVARSLPAAQFNMPSPPFLPTLGLGLDSCCTPTYCRACALRSILGHACGSAPLSSITAGLSWRQAAMHIVTGNQHCCSSGAACMVRLFIMRMAFANIFIGEFMLPFNV